MNNRSFPSSALTLLALIASIIAPSPCWSASDLDRARDVFKDPPREYSSGPLWVWNDMLTDEQIRSTMRDLAGQKVKQVWVHPRPGLMTPYLSKEWFHLWDVALEEARKLDMNVWIYDENSYPSGFAGGWVPEVMPESRGRGLVMREAKEAPKWTDDIVGIYHVGGEAIANVTQKLKSGSDLGEGPFQIFTEVRAGNSPWHGNRCYVNLLSPGVTEKFLELTMEPYRKQVGAEFGKRIPGVFTDEPNIRPVGELPWSEILAAEFEKRWGYSLLAHLPSLKQQAGDWKRVRHNYMQVLNEQFVEHWGKPNHDWYEAHGLEWTGHYWDHEWPDCMGVPDNMAMYAWHQRPAIDCLMNQYAEHTHAQFGNARMVRELGSVANQLGTKRTLCEVYGAGGWDLRFEDMKRIADWLGVLGVNTMNQHLSYVTIRGARKRDHPQSFSYHEPWWDSYHVSADYLTHLCAALSQGEQVNRILVIEPTTTAWMYQGDGAGLKRVGDAFFKLVMALEAAQVEYDLASEDILARHGSVDKALVYGVDVSRPSSSISRPTLGLELKVGKRSYSRVVIPEQTENLNESTVKLLESFLAANTEAEVLCAAVPPARIDGKVADGLKELARRPGWKIVGNNALVEMLKPTGKDGFAIFRAEGDKGILFHQRRTLGGGEILVLVNTSMEHWSEGSFESAMEGVEAWNLYNGTIESFPFEKTGSGIRANFKLPPSGSLVLALSDEPVKPAVSHHEMISVLKPQFEPSARRIQPNVLTLDFVDVTAGGESRSDIYFYRANQFAWQKNGMERDPWDSAVQFKDELISKSFPPTSGFEASYSFNLEGPAPTNLAIVVERPDLYTITCNGQSVGATPGQWWLDKAFGVIPIAAQTRSGKNSVHLKAGPFTMYHELEPAYLLGDFGLRAGSSGFDVVAEQPITAGPHGWSQQGYPFYSAGVAYTEQFQVEKPQGTYVLRLHKWLGSVARVNVNGQAAGYVDAPPWRLDVSKFIKAGDNVVEVTVIGTLKNTLGPHHGKPALGSAWPGGFQQGPPIGPPPGGEYSTAAYGLFEPFDLENGSSK